MTASPKKKEPSTQRPLINASHVPAYIIELFYGVRTKIESFLDSRMNGAETQPYRIAVTSLEPAAGKSTITANIALSFAQKGVTTLLIDADLRRGTVHTLFDIPNEPGLSDFLAASQDNGTFSTAEDGVSGMHDDHSHTAGPSPLQVPAVYTPGISTLSIVPSGTIQRSPADLLSTPACARMLEAFSHRFDMVLIDTPPIEPMTDAVVLSPHVQGYVVVANAGKTNIKAMEAKVDEYPSVKQKIAGIVLNCAQIGTTKKSYYHYYLKNARKKRGGSALSTRETSGDSTGAVPQ